MVEATAAFSLARLTYLHQPNIHIPGHGWWYAVTVITRIAVAYEAGRDGFWLARWLRARGRRAKVRSRRARTV